MHLKRLLCVLLRIMQVFELRNQEYIELNKLLKLLQIAESGAQANLLVVDGKVKVNNQPATEKRKKLRHGDEVRCRGQVIRIQNPENPAL